MPSRATSPSAVDRDRQAIRTRRVAIVPDLPAETGRTISSGTPSIAGIAFERDEAKLTVTGVPDLPGTAYNVIGPVSEAGIEVDVIVQNAAADGTNDITFTVKRGESERAKSILDDIASSLKARAVDLDTKICKVSLVGVGMKSHAGIASEMFKVLAQEGINIKIITTSEINF